MSLPKNFDHTETEQRLYQKWEKEDAFACHPHSEKDPYCIMFPPPNVTGSLHMGHGLTFTLQDILIRYMRMRGRDALWQPGTDHAGIATQMVVERQLAAQGQDRRDMGREAFLEKVWEWKEESGGTIIKQLRHLGASADWARERFTMDEGLSEAVTRVFVQLYEEGLIYKAERLVNWDPKMLTAISDLEVESKEIKGHLWHLRYPIENSDEYVVVATTRPETMLGDTAVAIHPENEKLKHLIGKNVVLPLVGRLIPIIADDYADPEKGTGAVKITPAHDFNDFEVGKRHDLEAINIFDKFAHINESAPEKYRGLERFEARKQIVVDFEALGLLETVESHVHAVPHGDRSGVPIEPWLSEQWYCDAGTLAKPALKAVESGRTKFVPEQWTNTYYAWMRNIEPWCISRQLWWGHQIPAWYGPDDTYFVAHNEDEAKAKAKAHYGKEVELRRDEDVLDTWFSSALWPFTTLGWPEKTDELNRYYPTSTLVTGFDIIFFWVARMMMMGLHFMKDVPFDTIYIHALVRDEKGQKMSKTKGNVIDPLDMANKYGADALRFTMASLSTPGRDIRLAVSRIEGNRNFTTKLWNAARFCQMNECAFRADFDPTKVTQTVNKWIISETVGAAKRIADHLDLYRFDLASQEIYSFVWNSFCDWYLEFSKPLLTDESAGAETKDTTAWVLAQMLKIMHPMMPFVTEELWGHIVGDGSLLMTQNWPQEDIAHDKEAAEEMNWVIDLISSIRGVRAELNVPVKAEITLLVKDANAKTKARLETHALLIKRLAKIDEISETSEVPNNAAQKVLGEATFIMPLEGIIDVAKETARLEKEIAKQQAEIQKTEQKLANDNFVQKAPQEVIDEHRQRLVDAQALVARLDEARRNLVG
ncbi:MAG: valine--tRNA ligase [Bdellovibrionales bacterium]